MDVCVLEARQHQATLEIVHGRLGADESAGAVVTADEDDLAVADGHRLGPRALRIDRVDLAAVVDAVGGGVRAGHRLLDDLAALDDVRDVLEGADVGERVAFHGDQVPVASHLDGADVGGHVHVRGSDRRGGADGVHRLHAAAHHDRELLAVQAVLQNPGVRAVQERNTRCVGLLEDDTLRLGGLVVLAHELLGVAEFLADFRREGAVIDVHRECNAAFGRERDRLVVGERRVRSNRRQPGSRP